MQSRQLKNRAFLSILAFCGLQMACVTRGRDFSSDITWIKKNQTTQTDASRLLGSPTAVGSTGGIPTWTYGYYDYRLFGDSDTKELKIYWNGEQKVQDFSFNSSFPSDRQRLMLGK